MVDLSKILEKNKSGWIALSPDNKRVVSTGKNLNEVLEKAKDNGVENPGLLRASSQNKFYVG
jgi:hypothetical protein